MKTFLQFIATLPVMIICYQLYAYSANSTGTERQNSFLKLGIGFMTIGITALVAREPVFVFMGLILIMAGFRLMAKGLDRLDKNLFIDRYNGHNNGTEPDKKEKGN